MDPCMIKKIILSFIINLMLMNGSYSGIAVEDGDDTRRNHPIIQGVDETEKSQLNDRSQRLSPVRIDDIKALQKRSASIRVTVNSGEDPHEIVHESYADDRERQTSETYIREIKHDIPHNHERSVNR